MSAPASHRVVILSCSASKLSEPAPARRMYTGVVWQAWRRELPGAIPNEWSTLVLSAKHGLITPCRRIEPYDVRMTPQRAVELAHAIAAQFEAWCEWRSENRDLPFEVAVVGGESYQLAAQLAGLPVSVRIDGRSADGRGGIGVMRQRAAQFAAEIRRDLNVSVWGDRAWAHATAQWGVRYGVEESFVPVQGALAL